MTQNNGRDTSTETLFADARRARAQGDLARALALVDNVLQKNPDDLDALSLRATILQELTVLADRQAHETRSQGTQMPGDDPYGHGDIRAPTMSQAHSAPRHAGAAEGAGITIAAGVGAWPRLGAYLLDVVLFLLCYLACLFAVLVIVQFTADLDLLSGDLRAATDGMLDAGSVTLLPALYFIGYEWLFGATPGKAILRMRVVRTDGRACGLIAAFVRHLLRPIDSLIFCLPALISMREPLNQRIGDRAARTLVVSSRTPVSGTRLAAGRFWLATVLMLIAAVIVLYMAAAAGMDTGYTNWQS